MRVRMPPHTIRNGSLNDVASQGFEHARISAKFLNFGVLQIISHPGFVRLGACSDEKGNHLVIAGVPGFREGIEPALKRPSHKCGSKSSVFDPHGRFSFQEQLDDLRVSAIGGPMQSGLSMWLRVHFDTVIKQEGDDAGVTILTRPNEA